MGDHRASRGSLSSLVEALASPAFYPSCPASVEVVQTHISWVFLAGAEVFKVKKPVRFSFLDFSDLEKRRHYCAEEVRLNRRLAPDTYLGVVGIRATSTGYELCDDDADGVVEVAVHMRRLPDDRMLPALLELGLVDNALIDVIVERLVDFHRHADSGEQVRAAGAPEVLSAQMVADFDEMAEYRGRTISVADDMRIQRFCSSQLAARDCQLRDRQARGRVRDGHGDLHAEHVCVAGDGPGGLIIFDCIEFSPAFRCRDVAAEIAFLAMDLTCRGHPELSDYLVARYSQLAEDPELPELVPMFACHRAYIRGKVDSLKSAEPEVPAEERAAAADSARRHFALANRYAWAGTPRLLVIGGLSGTGKSTVARKVAERTGFVHLASDEIRKELAGLEPTSRAGAHDDHGLYAPAQSARTYDEMYARAGRALDAGQGVVLDATFARRADRQAARVSARDHNAALSFVECTCPQAEVERRLEARQRADSDPSDADVAVYRRQLATYQEYEKSDERLRVDTRRGTDEVVAEVERWLGRID